MTDSVAQEVSVALCTHNGVPFIAEQVRSILHQSVPPTQIVLSDDASTDATVPTVREIVARFRAERPKLPLQLIVLANTEPLGVTANFQQAVEACTGDLVALCDQDDVWAIDKLAVIIDQFVQHPELTLVHTNARLVDDRGAAIGEDLVEAIGYTAGEQRAVRDGRGLDVLLRRNVVTGATTVFRRSLLGAALPFPTSWVHDEWLAMVAAITGCIVFLPAPLIDYRQHGANQIGAAKPTTAQKVDRLRVSRSDRNALLLQRAEALAARAPQLTDRAQLDGTSKFKRNARTIDDLAAGKLAHERARSALPAARILRVIPVVAEVFTGRYQRYGRARYDIVRDLIQPG